MGEAEPIFEEAAVSAPARRASGDPASMVVRGVWFYPVTLLIPLGVFAAGYGFATQSTTGLLMFAVVGALVGLMMTMVAMAWGSAIAFTDGTRAGILFTVFPPYMPYFAVTRWRSMAQPSVLFLAGLSLAVATLWTVKMMTPAP